VGTLQTLGGKRSGVYQDQSEYVAWINYKPPYDEHGGNWYGSGMSPEQAVKVLYDTVREYLQRKSIN
jgi:hypothetical protein